MLDCTSQLSAIAVKKYRESMGVFVEWNHLSVMSLKALIMVFIKVLLLVLIGTGGGYGPPNFV